MSQEHIDFVAQQRHVPQNLIVYLTRTDELIREPMRTALKMALEAKPLVVDGFHNSLNVEVEGEGRLAGAKSISYDKLTPHFVIPELYGTPVYNLFSDLAVKNIEDGTTFDILVVEPDATLQHVVSAWHCKNMWVKRLVGPQSKRDLRPGQSSAQTVEVFFNCEVVRDVHVQERAAQIMRASNFMAANPHAREGFMANLGGDDDRAATLIDNGQRPM